MPTIDELLSLSARHQEIIKRVGNGGLDVAKALAAAQEILDGKYPVVHPVTAASVGHSFPSYYVPAAVQVSKCRALLQEHGGGKNGFRPVDIPDFDEAAFVPSSESEFPLLTVYLPSKGKMGGVQRTFDIRWLCITPSTGFTKRRTDATLSDPEHLKLIDGYEHKPGVRWVGFDPNTARSKSPLWCEANPIPGRRWAHAEVLNAAAVMPNWANSWNGTSSPYPNMSGYRTLYGTGWSDTPYLDRWDDDRELELGVDSASNPHALWCSPSVREL